MRFHQILHPIRLLPDNAGAEQTAISCFVVCGQHALFTACSAVQYSWQSVSYKPVQETRAVSHAWFAVNDAASDVPAEDHNVDCTQSLLLVHPSADLADDADAKEAVSGSRAALSGSTPRVPVGMRVTAMDGWAVLHCSPFTAMAFYFVPQLCTLSALLILLTGVDFFRFHLTVPLLVGCAPYPCVHGFPG